MLGKKTGKELVTIAKDLISELKKDEYNSILKKWTVYIIPKSNPDGVDKGRTNNGYGRCTYKRI